jgi:hypothetical protein
MRSGRLGRTGSGSGVDAVGLTGRLASMTLVATRPPSSIASSGIASRPATMTPTATATIQRTRW